MAAASLVVLALIILTSALLLFVTVGNDVLPRTLVGLRRNAPWLALLLIATALERSYSRLVPDHSYLLRMSAQTEVLAVVPIWLQSVIPASVGPSFFGTIYVAAFLICLIVVPLYLMATERDALFRRYCASLGLAYLLLIVLHLTILSVRPGLDPGSGIAGLLYSDPFWGPISVDLVTRGNSLPSGHTITLTATAVAIWPAQGLRWAVLVLLSVTVVAILYLGIHWPVDVIAGLILGVASGLVAVRVVEKWERKRFKREIPGSP
jgi:membrane-associated phospholipid phosphatase